MVHIALASDFAERWGKLKDMEERVGRKGFDPLKVLGKADHEIRGLACNLMPDGALFVAAGDKAGGIYVTCVDVLTGETRAGRSFRKSPPLTPSSSEHRVVDFLQIAGSGADAWLIAGTRGNGAWRVPVQAILSDDDDLPYEQLTGSQGVVRRLMLDGNVLWAAIDTRLMAWTLDNDAQLSVRLELGARITAIAVDRGKTSRDDHLYVATNRSALYMFSRDLDGAFPVTAEAIATQEPAWRGRSSVIETIIPLSDFAVFDELEGEWRRRFRERGVVVTTLRHVMTIIGTADGHVECDTRRVSMLSKILAAAPICLADWYGIAIATLEGRIRLYRPSGIRSAGHDFAPFCAEAPENQVPRSIIGGWEDIDFLKERVYAFGRGMPFPANGESASIIVGMGDHSVRLYRISISWQVRQEAQNIAAGIAQTSAIDPLLKAIDHSVLRPTDPARDKYAATVLLPELGRLCETEDSWRNFKLLVWDILGGTESIDRIPVHVVQSLRRLQMLPDEKREELEQTIFLIRKHIFDKESFSGKQSDFLRLTKSTDRNLDDDRVVYQSILVSRRHDPVFKKTFAADAFGEVQAFAAFPETDQPDPTRPAAWRFVVGTYRLSIRLFNGEGESIELSGHDRNWGHAQAILLTPRRLVFGFSKGAICSVSREALLAPLHSLSKVRFELVENAAQDPEAAPLCFTRLPSADPEDERFLSGHANGSIYLCNGTSAMLAKVPEEGSPYDKARTNALESFVAEINGERRGFVVAGTDLGFLHLFEWFDGAEPRLEFRSNVRVGTSAVTALLSHGNNNLKQVVAACADGNVVGTWVLTNEEHEPVLSVYWAFKAGESVRDLQQLSLNVGTGNGTDTLIGIASHDQHLHIVDHAGRHLETIYVKNVKLDRFVAVPEIEAEPLQKGIVECRIYACAFENEFLSFRLISRREMLIRLRDTINDLDTAERERRLTCWRAYAIHEGHLRHRFVRQSRRYPGANPESTMNEVRRLTRFGASDEAPTGVVTALLRRLFQNRWPGEEDLPEIPMGLRALFEHEDLYHDAVKLLVEIEEQWDTPGSLSNRRAQYFWIRSLLRNIDDLEMLRTWLRIGNATGAASLAAPDKIIYHYLEHPSEIVQFKVLQCLERMLFGWPGIDRPGVFSDKADITIQDIDWILKALLSRLTTLPSDITPDRPNLVVLQIGKIFCHLLRTHCVDPLYLAYRLQAHNISTHMYTILHQQCTVMSIAGARASVHRGETTLTARKKRNAAEDTRLREGAAAIRDAQALQETLNKGSSLKERTALQRLIADTKAVARHCEHRSSGTYGRFLEETARFYGAVEPLLDLSTIEDAGQLHLNIVPTGPSSYYVSYERLSAFRDVISTLRDYLTQKYNDIFGSPLLQALQFEGFNDAREAWRRARSELIDLPDTAMQLEQLLLGSVVQIWDALVDAEQNEHLLRDLMEFLQRDLFSDLDDRGDRPVKSGAEIDARVASGEELTAAAFINLFLRLVLVSEPVTAAFIRPTDETSVSLRWFDARMGQRPAIIEGYAQEWPQWVNPMWSDPEELQRLDNNRLHRWLATTPGGLQWEEIPIPDMSENELQFGYFIFGWSPGAEGYQRYASASRMKDLLLQALTYKKGSLQQQALTGRVFSMIAHNLGSPIFQLCSDARVLADGFLEQDSLRRRLTVGAVLDSRDESRFDKYYQLLRQSRHMQGIVDAILSIEGRTVVLRLTSVSLAAVVYDVVRTVRKEAEGWVQIEYPRPDDETLKRKNFYTDEIRVYDIMLNLLTNAVKYSPQGATVQVQASVTTHGAELRVRDEGSPIPVDERKRIFLPFVRGQQARSENVPGLGLGLYVVDLYTKALDGRIGIVHESGLGKSFVVYIPPRLEPSDETVIDE